MTNEADHDDTPGSAPAGEPNGLPGMPGTAGMDLGAMLASAQEALSAQAQAAEQAVEGTAGGSTVRVTMTGAGEVTAVNLSAGVVDPDDVEMLQDLIVAALRDAATKVTALQREALGAFGNLASGQVDLGDLGAELGDMLNRPDQ